MSHDPTRRRFLETLALLGTATLAAATTGLVGCGGGGGSARSSGRSRIEDLAKKQDENLDCTDTKGLWPAEIETRPENEYVERSPHKEKYCFNCTNFIKPKQPRTCGTCKNVKGPINPLGHCKAWTEARV
jgi:hypothetical protein